MTYEFDLHESKEEGRKEAEAKAFEEKKSDGKGFSRRWCFFGHYL